MIIAHYEHRLPADYDIASVRARAKRRGPLWDTVEDLYFKGFLLREAGSLGAIANSYSSLYLWRSDEAFRDFLASGRYRSVTDQFGRASIRTRVVLDAHRGDAQHARFAYVKERDIPGDIDLTDAFASEIQHNREIAAQPGIVAAVLGVDTLNWRLTRILFSDGQRSGQEDGTGYEVLYLARPLLDTLAAVNTL
jgi:hypothetical protein